MSCEVRYNKVVGQDALSLSHLDNDHPLGQLKLSATYSAADMATLSLWLNNRLVVATTVIPVKLTVSQALGAFHAMLSTCGVPIDAQTVSKMNTLATALANEIASIK